LADTGAAVDLKAEMLAAAEALAGGPASGGGAARRGAAMTSDLSIDEEFALHSVGWEPVELVCGISLVSVPPGVWTWGQGEIVQASDAHARAFAGAGQRIHRECAKAGGHGVVGVHVEAVVQRNHVDVTLLGTAVRPVGAKNTAADAVFVSDLSGRDFSLLMASGWAPLGLAVGASFVYAPRRSAGTALKQSSQNIELTNFTEAMYAARESAMERMQEQAIALRGTGVVEVKVAEGPMNFAHHAVGFTAYGTVVRLSADAHRRLDPMVIVPLDDSTVAFDATSLRGE
jgi:uncharacterized protein YbjQ (UPF0145 family)